MRGKRKIPAREVVQGIQSGMSDSQIMRAYGLSQKRLWRLYQRLIDAGAINIGDVSEGLGSNQSQADNFSERRFPRIEVTFAFPIFDLESMQTGLVRDISEHGVRVAGIHAKVGEAKRFRIPLRHIMDANSLVFDASCRWMEVKGRSKKYVVGGYEITDIHESCKEDLISFVRLFCEQG